MERWLHTSQWLLSKATTKPAAPCRRINRASKLHCTAQGKRERKLVSYEGAGGGEMADSDFEVSSAAEESASEEEELEEVR